MGLLAGVLEGFVWAQVAVPHNWEAETAAGLLVDDLEGSASESRVERDED